MNYTKLASEARKLYHALRDAEFDANQAYGITEVCVRDYPIFRGMIEEDPKPVIGYIHFINGDKKPIYEKKKSTMNSYELHTDYDIYIVAETYDPYSFLGVTSIEYYRYNKDSVMNDRVFNIDRIEMLEEGSV
jgi:hypothetical protein